MFTAVHTRDLTPNTSRTARFEGAPYGSEVSFFLVDNDPGQGPALHRHPYAGDDLRGTSLRGATMLVLFHEVYAVRTHDNRPAGLPQLSYIAFISQARNQAIGALAHLHWFLYTEDEAGVPGKYRDAKLADITRSQAFSKQRRGETQVRERFSAVADSGGFADQSHLTRHLCRILGVTPAALRAAR